MAGRKIYNDPEEVLAVLDSITMDSDDDSEDDLEIDDCDSDDLIDDPDFIPNQKELTEDLDDDIAESVKDVEHPKTKEASKPPPRKRSRINKDLTGNKKTGQKTPLLKQPSQMSVADYLLEPKATNGQILGKSGFQWATQCTEVQAPKTRKKNIVHIRPGPTGQAKQAKEPIGCFRLFFSEHIMGKIITNTNVKIEECAKNYAKQEGSLQAVTLEELEAYFGLLYLAAALRANHLTTNILFQTEYCGSRFVSTMSRRRFEFLTSALRFDDRETRDERKLYSKMAPIKDIWELLIDNCKNNYKPSSYLTVDEQLVSFRGRCAFKMYIPSKPCKYGLKIVMMCDNASKYLVNAIPYCGKGSVPPDVAAGEYYVKTLAEHIKGSNRNITMDNWFTSVGLMSDLLNEYNLTAVGTVRKNKKELPPCFVEAKYENRIVESSMFLFSPDITAVSYKPNSSKVVCLLSSMHDDNAVSTSAGHKPEIILTYNATKGAVDTFDEMCRVINTSRKTRRWPHCFFYNMLNIAAINSYVIYLHNFYAAPENKSSKPLSRIDFMLKLSKQLTSGWQKHRLANVPTLSRELKQQIRKVLCVEEPTAEFSAGDQKGNRKYCAYCPYSIRRKTSIFCANCRKYICGEHQKKVCHEC